MDKASYANLLQFYEKVPKKYIDNAQMVFVLNTGIHVKNQTLAGWSKGSRIMNKIKYSQ